MNIKITNKDNKVLENLCDGKILMGSHLYKTNNKNSDKDYMCFYSEDIFDGIYVPSIHHQLQYDDLKNNTQFIWTTKSQFWDNQRSGDATINSDIVLFSDLIENKTMRLELCRTYKIIKAYLGFAKRDIKQSTKIKDAIKKNKKICHAYRGLTIATSLILNELPLLMDFNTKTTFDVSYMLDYEKYLRIKLNEMYNNNEIKTYYVPELSEKFDTETLSVISKLFNSANTKEFTY